ncbi:MAG: hypothetical protein BWY07_02662 [Candidatus Hydrogenedentes bacterium ADurb.Bin170]|nr:MAG: hypothetical protein BWY07_02662 [Candidatus Hydrogenedentes bacterium ADurb.Bin170]
MVYPSFIAHTQNSGTQVGGGIVIKSKDSNVDMTGCIALHYSVSGADQEICKNLVGQPVPGCRYGTAKKYAGVKGRCQFGRSGRKHAFTQCLHQGSKIFCGLQMIATLFLQRTRKVQVQIKGIV